MMDLVVDPTGTSGCSSWDYGASSRPSTRAGRRPGAVPPVTRTATWCMPRPRARDPADRSRLPAARPPCAPSPTGHCRDEEGLHREADTRAVGVHVRRGPGHRRARRTNRPGAHRGAVLQSSTAHLETWLASEVRCSLLRRGECLCAAAPHQHLLVGEHDRECVSVARGPSAVPAGEEDAFLLLASPHREPAAGVPRLPRLGGACAGAAGAGHVDDRAALRLPAARGPRLASAEHERASAEGARFTAAPARCAAAALRADLALPAGLVAACAAVWLRSPPSCRRYRWCPAQVMRANVHAAPVTVTATTISLMMSSMHP